MDGVSQKVGPYLATPPDIKDSLLSEAPDALVFTHTHEDHYDPAFADAYLASANGVIIGPGHFPEYDSSLYRIGTITIKPVKNRHIGKAGEVAHYSYIISGSHCIWFVGDASPLQWHQDTLYQKPDVLIAPFAYAATESAWELTKAMGAKTVILIHMPKRNEDPFSIWNAVESVISNESNIKVLIPQLGESIIV